MERHRHKVIVLGMPDVGKTTLARIINSEVKIDKDLFILYITEKDFSDDIMQIQGLSGKEQFKPLIGNVINDKNFEGVIYLFNTNDYETLDGLESYIEIARSNLDDPCEVLLGNVHYEEDVNKVKPGVISSFVNKHSIKNYLEFSINDPESVEKVFKELYDCIESKNQ